MIYVVSSDAEILEETEIINTEATGITEIILAFSVCPVPSVWKPPFSPQPPLPGANSGSRLPKSSRARDSVS